MTEKETSGSETHLTFRVTQDELDRFTRMQERLQERLGPKIRATKKLTFLEALEKLETYFASLERRR